MRSAIFLLLLWSFCLVGNGQDSSGADKAGTPARPLSIGLVVDNSGSYRAVLERVISSVNSVIDDMKEGDQAFLVTFADTQKISLRQEITGDRSELRDAAENMYIQGGPTAMLDAVLFSARYMAEQSKPDEDRARVLLLISDGDERKSDSNVEQVVTALRSSKIKVFVLGLYDERFHTKVIDRLIKETGGAKFVPRFPRETPAAVSTLLALIREG